MGVSAPVMTLIGISRNVGGISIRHIGEPARGIHHNIERSCHGGEGRSWNGRKSAASGVDGVSRNVIRKLIRHIAKLASGVHRHGDRKYSGGEGRSWNGRKGAGGGVDRVPRNVIGKLIRHISELAEHGGREAQNRHADIKTDPEARFGKHHGAVSLSLVAANTGLCRRRRNSGGGQRRWNT